MLLVDTHCHIQDKEYPLDVKQVMQNSLKDGVGVVVLASYSFETSRLAVDLAMQYSNQLMNTAEAYALIGIHPSEAHKGYKSLEDIYKIMPKDRIIGVGEIGLDYHYGDKYRAEQIEALEWQIDFALKYNLPIEFHVRDAFDDFWPIIDNFDIKKADLHSFTDSIENAEEALKRGFYIGLNGISTFTKIKWQQELYSSIPLRSILFETDAPFLTPSPYRGRINQPARIRQIAEFHAQARGLSLEEVAGITNQNFKNLFNL